MARLHRVALLPCETPVAQLSAEAVVWLAIIGGLDGEHLCLRLDRLAEREQEALRLGGAQVKVGIPHCCAEILIVGNVGV